MFLGLAAFPEQHIFRTHPGYSGCQSFIPFYVWILSRCQEASCFVCAFICQRTLGCFYLWAVTPRAAVNVGVSCGQLISVCSPQHNVLTPQRDAPHEGFCPPPDPPPPRPWGMTTWWPGHAECLIPSGIRIPIFPPRYLCPGAPQLGTLSSVPSLPSYLFRVLHD